MEQVDISDANILDFRTSRKRKERRGTLNTQWMTIARKNERIVNVNGKRQRESKSTIYSYPKYNKILCATAVYNSRNGCECFSFVCRTEWENANVSHSYEFLISTNGHSAERIFGTRTNHYRMAHGLIVLPNYATATIARLIYV